MVKVVKNVRPCFYGQRFRLQTGHTTLRRSCQKKDHQIKSLGCLNYWPKTHTTPCHSQANGIVQRNNRLLRDFLRAVLLKRGEGELVKLLYQPMTAYSTTPTQLVTSQPSCCCSEENSGCPISCHTTLHEKELNTYMRIWSAPRAGTKHMKNCHKHK